MQEKNVKIGMRVVPIKKTIGDRYSPEWAKIQRPGEKQKFLYVTEIDKAGFVYLSSEPVKKRSDAFNFTDFKRYKETRTELKARVRSELAHFTAELLIQLEQQLIKEFHKKKNAETGDADSLYMSASDLSNMFEASVKEIKKSKTRS